MQRRLPSAHRPLPTAHSRSAFTLVELLVVIAIIGILASLLVVAGRAAYITAVNAALRAETTQINDGFTEYGNRYGTAGTFPPNVVNTGRSLAERTVVYQDFERHFKKAFPKSKEPVSLLRAIAGVSQEEFNLEGGISPYEAIVFWLRGFSKDEAYPISGPGGPSFLVKPGVVEELNMNNAVYPFDVARLGPRESDNTFGVSNGGRFIKYQVNVNGAMQSRQINFWWYFPRNRKLPYAYFDCSREVGDRAHPQSGNLVAIKTLTSAASTAQQPTVRNIRYANDGRCQILCCGLDDEWGDFSGFFVEPNQSPDTQLSVVLYPEGPFIGEVGDTITNFTNNATLADDQP